MNLMKGRYNPLLLAVIVIGLVSALWLNVARHTIEQKNNTVELAMEYEGLRKVAALQGLPEQDVLLQFKEAGINSLMIFDTTLERLTKNGELQTATGGELRQSSALGADKGVFANVPVAAVEENAAYIAAAKDATILTDVEEDLRLRYGADRVQVVSDNPRIVKIKGSTEPLPDGKYDEPLGIMQAPLGLPAQDLRKVSALGFKIIVRPQNYVNVTDKQIDAIFERIKKAGVPVHALMPCGTESVGYPDKIGYLGERMRENKMTLVMLEHYTQLQFAKIDGMVQLGEAVDYNAARSYVIDPLEQKKISVGEALRRWALTDEERNIRINYIRTFMMPKEGKDIMQINLQYVRDIKASVEARGYKIGEAGVFNSAEGNGYAPYFPNKVLLVPSVLAVVAGMVLYLALLFNMSAVRQVLLWVVLSAMALGLLFIGRGLLTRQLLSLAAASVFPVLSMSVIFNIWDKNTSDKHSLPAICFKGLWQLALAVTLSLVGAAFMSAIMTDSRFLLEIDIYRGVKLTFILPVLLTAILFIKRYDLLQVVGRGLAVLWQRLNGLLDTGLTFRHVAVLVVLLFVAYYFVGRSGHTGGVPVPAIELKMRALLEQLMYARPREKEFMVGHPAFFIAVLAVYRCAPRWWQFVLACAAVIGQGSLVQTFCHMRTPVIMSFLRAIDGYAVGAVFGIIGVLMIGALLPFVLKLRRRYLEQ